MGLVSLGIEMVKLGWDCMIEHADGSIGMKALQEDGTKGM